METFFNYHPTLPPSLHFEHLSLCLNVIFGSSSLLEVGIWEEEEHLLELSLPEEVGEVLHGVGPEAGDVAVPTGRGMLLSQSGDSG